MIQEEIKLPYQIYVATGQSPLHALSWRLKSEGPQKLPNAWILLIGSVPKMAIRLQQTNSKVGQPLEDIIKLIGKVGAELGKQLAQTNYGLVTSIDSFDRSVHEPSILAYVETFTNAKSPANIKDYLRHYNLELEHVIEPGLNYATTITFLTSEHNRLMERMTLYPDAVILIGGKEGDFLLALDCIQRGRPVFPIVESGGAAKQFYDLLIPSYNQEAKELSGFGANINLKNVYQHPLDVEALDRPFKSAIAEIISHLNMIYAPDDPKMYSFE